MTKKISYNAQKNSHNLNSFMDFPQKEKEHYTVDGDMIIDNWN